MRKIVCDRCGNEITRAEPEPSIMVIKSEGHYDLCYSCRRELERWISAANREQTARVMVWEEIARIVKPESSPVWIEDKEKVYVMPALVLWGDETKQVFRVRDGDVTGHRYNHGKQWRCWTLCPNEQQRKDTPWKTMEEE